MVDRRHLRISDAVVVRDLDGESVLLNIESGLYFGLDRIGTRIWQLIEEHGDVDAIVRVMQDEYDADPQTLRADAEALIAALLEKRLIVETGDA
jgi:hypothetical protein